MESTYDRVLVTGGAGFIGSHTVDALLDAGSRVWVLDDLSNGSLRNLAKWKGARQLRFEHGSVAQPKAVDSMVKRVDALIHLAAAVSANLSLSNPEAVNEANVTGTLNVLRAANRHRLGRVVFASSAAIYGNSTAMPLAEDTNPNPTTPYGVSKLAAEKYCRVYSESLGLPVVSLRYFNVYGPRQGSSVYGSLIPVSIYRLSRGLRPIIYGDGRQTRDFVHVSDVVRANMLALEAKRGIGGAFNIGTGRESSVRTVVRILTEAMNKTALSPIFRKARRGDARRGRAATLEARRKLGFRSKVDLQNGLRLLANQSPAV